MSRVSEKALISAADISPILYVNDAGLKVVVDDDFVQVMEEGQSMIVKIVDILSFGASNTQYEIRLEY